MQNKKCLERCLELIRDKRYRELSAILAEQNPVDLADLLEEDGWLTGSGPDFIELELEDERNNPKYGILTVKGYLQKARFAPDTTIELAGTPTGIYD